MDEPFSLPPSDRFMEYAEESADSAMKVYGDLMAAAGKVTEEVEQSRAMVGARSLALQRQALAAADDTVTACLDFAGKLAGARCMGEVLNIQSMFVTDRIGAMREQAVDLARAGTESAVAFQEHLRARL